MTNLINWAGHPDVVADAVAQADAELTNVGLPSYSQVSLDVEQLRAALEALVKLHAAWDKGTAYIPVKFMHDNNAAIKAAREAIANSKH